MCMWVAYQKKKKKKVYVSKHACVRVIYVNMYLLVLTVVQLVEYIRVRGDRKHHRSIGLETSTKAIPLLESISTSSRS